MTATRTIRDPDRRRVPRRTADRGAARDRYPAHHRPGPGGTVLRRRRLGRHRPTGALEESLSGLSFCDLYAGSGAVGLEAASRGAGPGAADRGGPRATAQLIRRNAADLGLVVEVAAARVEQRLRQPPATAYDVVFADPPYELDARRSTVCSDACVEQRWVGPDGLLILERSRRTRDPVWPSRGGGRLDARLR